MLNIFACGAQIIIHKLYEKFCGVQKTVESAKTFKKTLLTTTIRGVPSRTQVSLQKVGSQIQRIPEISTKKIDFLFFSFLMSSRSLQLCASFSTYKTKLVCTKALLLTPSELGDIVHQRQKGGPQSEIPMKSLCFVQWDFIGFQGNLTSLPTLDGLISELRWSQKECFGANELSFI